MTNLGDPLDLDLAEEIAESGPWKVLLDSEDPRYSGEEHDLRQSRPEQAIVGKRVTMDGPRAIILQPR